MTGSPSLINLFYALQGLQTVDVRTYGASGNGVNNDATAIQAAITATPSGGVLVIPPGTSFYKISSGLTVNKPMTIIGYGAEIGLRTNGVTAFTITANNVTLKGFKVTGNRNNVANSLERGVYANGTSSTVPITGVTLVDLEISTFGFYGINLRKCEDVTITGCFVHDIFNSGISLWSIKRGRVQGNKVQRITGTDPNGSYYGIAITRDQTQTIVTDHRSYDVLVADNYVSDNPVWDGLNTHGGVRLTFTRNVVVNCAVGIDIVNCPAPPPGEVNAYAPIDVVVTDNIIDSTVTDGTAQNGITFAGAANILDPIGAPGVVTVAEYATGVIRGNIINNHGQGVTNVYGAIYAHTCRGVIIEGNVIKYPTPNGIVLLNNAQGVIITGNTITDAWSNQGFSAYGIWVKGPTSSANVYGNFLPRGSYNIGDNTSVGGPTGVNSIFANPIRLENTSGVLTNVGLNWSQSGSALILDAGARAKAPFSGRVTTAGIEMGYRSVAVNYTALASDHTIAVDATTGPITVTIGAGTNQVGREYIIVKTDATANAVTVVTTNSETMNGVSSLSTTTRWESLILTYQEPNWLAWRRSGA